MFTKGHKINVGRVYTDERNEKVRQSKLGKKRPWTQEWKEKIAQSIAERHQKGEEFGFKKGEKNIKWNGGISTEIQRIRACKEYQAWTKRAKKHSDECARCGSNELLEADHFPITFSEIVEKNSIKTLEQARECIELWEAESRILCRKCHRNF